MPSLMVLAPSEPPNTSSIVASAGMPSDSRPASPLALMTLARTGFPVRTTCPVEPPLRSKAHAAAGTEMQTRAAWSAIILLARPGTEFCSCRR